MTKPDIGFFVIGAARSGTTSLYRALEQHPDIFTPEVKEPRFFAGNWKLGWDWYSDIYANAPETAVLGDFSPNYTNTAEDTSNPVVRRMAEFYPQARLIYMVRNPIACAISNWRMAAELRGETIPFGQALEGDWAMGVYHRACFFRQISAYRQVFSDDQILAIPLEAMRADPDTWMAKAHAHIGVRPHQTTFPRANASSRKPNRPGAPDVSRAERQKFLSMIRQDALSMLDYMDMPASLWSLSPNARDWTPA
ncbi:sulfotransferase [Roseovarius sp. M141]|uniref:sulfotransferase family protein n=1 Tax=Roseovarius sp. M141 TaxID=2583806 RepID=UPI0020CF6AD0|nr:sulfotransferase [Roseovarius sp. M141]MCQ0090555.1 sulfotransferase [Roseovarius sp. M141]